MKTKNSLLFVFLILTFCNSLFAQEKNEDKKAKYKHQYLKVSLLEFFSGDFSFFYERSINKKISAEIGTGIVFKNFIREFVDESTSSAGRKVVPGMSFNFGIRYYPYIPGELFYLSADYKYRRYRTKYTTTGNNGENLNFNEYNGRSIYRLGVGYNLALDSRMFLDFYSGIGFWGDSNKTYFQQINENTLEYEFIEDIQKETKLHFNIGIKFSYKL
ncbi:MAG: DUF3575 domain-containing protein [Crocinitomicaceae bacterium]|nr:DUF3575 domain-containing protein [Crocinitomicaceae bacterium]